MSDAITTMLVQIKGDATSAIQALKDFATASTTTATQVTVAQKTMAGAGSAATKMGQDVEAAGKHVAGMSYYFRSGMDQIRFALMGGGERAGFYAVDELIRGLVSSGVGIGTLIPIIGGLAAALGTGWLAWEQWTKGEREAAEQAKNLADTWKVLPGLIKQINDMQSEGLLSPQAASKYANMLTGRTALYMDQDGNVTTQAQSVRRGFRGRSGADLGEMVNTGESNITTDNRLLDPTKDHETIQKFAMDQATAGGTVSKEYVETLKQADALVQKINEESLTGLAKQEREIHNKAQAERDALKDQLDIAQAQMTPVNFASSDQVKKIRQAIQLSFSNETRDMQTALLGNVEKSMEAYKQVKGIVDDVNKAIADTSAKQAEEAGKRDEELQRQAQLQRDIQRSDLEDQIESVKSNALMTENEKLAKTTDLNAQLKKINDEEIQQLTALKGQAKSLSDQLELEKKIAELKHSNNQIDNQKTSGQQNSFGFQFGSAATDIQNKWTGWATESAKAFQDTWEGATNGVSAGLTHLFEYGAQKGQWFQQMWNGVVGSLISSFTKMAVSWVMNHVLMEVAAVTFYEVMKLLGLQDVAAKILGDNMKLVSHITGEASATTATAAGVTTRITAHAAAAGAGAAESQSSIPYVGPILAIAAVAAIVAAVMALAHGFKEGGYTGGGSPDQIAGVVHAGEWVTPANRVGAAANLLQQIHSGALTDGMVPRVGAGNQSAPSSRSSAAPTSEASDKTSIHMYFDKKKMVDAIAQSDSNRHFIVDVMGENIHKFQT